MWGVLSRVQHYLVVQTPGETVLVSQSPRFQATKCMSWTVAVLQVVLTNTSSLVPRNNMLPWCCVQQAACYAAVVAGTK